MPLKKKRKIDPNNRPKLPGWANSIITELERISDHEELEGMVVAYNLKSRIEDTVLPVNLPPLMVRDKHLREDGPKTWRELLDEFEADVIEGDFLQMDCDLPMTHTMLERFLDSYGAGLEAIALVLEFEGDEDNPISPDSMIDFVESLSLTNLGILKSWIIHKYENRLKMQG